MQQVLVLAGLLLALAFWWHIESNAPDPYAACQERATEVELRQCRNSVDFALSAGW